MASNTYDAVVEGERAVSDLYRQRSPYQNFLAERRAALGCTIENLERAKAILNDETCPIAVERAVMLVNQELVCLTEANRKLTCKALELNGEPNGHD